MTITISGLDAVASKIAKLGDPSELQKPMGYAVKWVVDEVGRYPPQSDANRRKSFGQWYQRGFGSHYARRDGGVTSRNTSETLGKKWTEKVTMGGASVVGEVGNTASYAVYVQGERQTGFHQKRNWVRADKFIQDKSKTIVSFFEEHYRELI